MSDLKHKTDAELVAEIQRNQKYIRAQKLSIAALKEEIGQEEQRLNNRMERQRWAIKYLSKEAP